MSFKVKLTNHMAEPASMTQSLSQDGIVLALLTAANPTASPYLNYCCLINHTAAGKCQKALKYCVTVVFDNGLPQFASATPDQLYDVLKRNMLQMPRAAFNQSQLNVNNEVANEVLYGCGSVMVIDPAVDLGVRPSDAIG